MKLGIEISLVAAGLVLSLSALVLGPVHAQGSGLTRAKAKTDRDEFLAMARCDEMVGNYVLRDDFVMPEGVLSSAEVRAMRDKFLSMHTWNDSESQWVPVNGAPRDMSKLTRDQVRDETARFLKMYRYDESASNWVSRSN